VFRRLRSDLQLTLITVFGTCALLGIPPFAIYRFASGDMATGIFDIVLVLTIGAVLAHAWTSKDTRGAALALVLINTTGAVASGLLLGASGLYWMYAVLMSNFFLTERRKAAIIAVGALAILLAHGKAFASVPHMAAYIATCVIVCVMSFIVAYRYEMQREQLQELSIQDPLTGIHNRRAMEHELEIAVEAAKRSGAVFGILMVDLDHFKGVNDHYGHDAGDQVLVAFARLIRHSTRAVDRAFRYGGEEFVVLLAGTPVAGLKLAAENLRQTVAAELRHPGGAITASIGGAMLQTGETWQAWLHRADAMLYRAKQGGRNRVEIDGLDGASHAQTGSRMPTHTQA
jgi:diguanylate cyclase (GGDEF)-like protein